MAKSGGYEVSSYTDKDIDGIVKVQSFLWGAYEEANREYFAWKHQKNPLLKRPVSVVAKHAGQVVGFLGNVPAECKVGDRKFPVLLNCDAVVHPKHRGKWLLSRMLRKAMELYSSEYRFFLSFTPSHAASILQSKLGWQPIATRNYLRHLNLLQMVRNKVLGVNQNAVRFGTSGDIEVSDTLRDVDVSGVNTASPWSANKLCLDKCPEFLQWRLSNRKVKFIYFYHLNGAKADAYVIISLNKLHAHVFDYGEEADSLGVERLISFILERTRFTSLSFLNINVPEALRVFLRKQHFRVYYRIEEIRNRELYNLPLLIRPTKAKYAEEDWFVGSIDIRDINNWHITEMCSD